MFIWCSLFFIFTAPFSQSRLVVVQKRLLMLVLIAGDKETHLHLEKVKVGTLPLAV